ncbi:uncharacterized protein LOC116028070 isoform X1 [Ipomoea triloba]|uniref:uncharacterized protein LOC116028070 isoform X1 n=1 Tax=Ipomoea triloba TaxID=35885 RepID=UPI00125DB29E|nr:uncharacterized protein LOC116028070 isoform X1 [Ipomoea triloba]
MLEDQVAYLLQRYLGNYVLGLNKEALKISVWQGDVELTNMQLKPEALNALKLPVRVKAGFLGSVKLKVPWSRLGQDPVVVHLDRIFLLAEPATQVEGSSEDAVQEVKKNRIREMETKLVESRLMLKTEMNNSWLQSFISTIIGNLKLSISNIHIRYEDVESNPGHPFAAGITLEKLSAMTVDDYGKETFITGGALELIQKSVELEKLAVYFDSDIIPWHIDKPWEDLLPVEWVKVFRHGTQDGKPADNLVKEHSYILQPVTGNGKFSKQRPSVSLQSGEPLQRAAVTLDDVTLCLSKSGYRDIIKLAENFSGFNQRLKYAHFRPPVMVKSNPRAWWKYAYKAVSDQIKKGSGKLSWEQVLRYASLRKKYISLYASLLKSDPDRVVIDDDKDVEKLDRELDIEIILQWRMLAHKFVKKSMESDLYVRKQKANKPWWSFGWSSQSVEDESAPGTFSEEDWERLNNIIGYKEGDEEPLFATHDRRDLPHTTLEIHMKHNASKLSDGQDCLADLSCDNLDCSIQLYSETKVFDIKLGSYQLLSPNGLIAESATAKESLVGVFCFKPLDRNVDWSLAAKASPCYVTYLKDSIDQIVNFFESNVAVSQTIALETAAAVQMTIDEVRRTAQQQVNRVLKDQTRFLLDLNIAAPKVTIPTDFSPDNTHSTKLLLDFGNLVIHTKDDSEFVSHEDRNMYVQFDLVLSDVSAFLVDGDYHWGQALPTTKIGGHSKSNIICVLPVIDKCGVILKLQQIRLQNPGFPSTRISVQLPSLGFHFSPARYHRLMQVAKIFERGERNDLDYFRPWSQADFEGWLSLLSWKGVGGREAVWQRRYVCIVGPFLYVLENPGSRSYKQYISLRGKQLYQVPPDIIGNVKHVLAVCDAERANNKIVEDANALILRYNSEESKRIWQRSLQGAIYRASGSAPISGLSESSSDSEDSEMDRINNRDNKDLSKVENLYLTGVLDELKMCFNYSGQNDHSFTKVLLEEENRLFEFRATGGRVELSIRGKDIFIGTVLKSLEIEDLVCPSGMLQPCYLARSFISSDTQIVIDAQGQGCNSNSSSQFEAEEKFYEAPEDLNDIDSPHALGGGSGLLSPTTSFSPGRTIIKAPSFNRIAGLLPTEATENGSNLMEVTDTFDSFVKAQVIIFDQNSPLYSNIDTKVVVTLATLSFFCRRPTIMAIMHFVNAINLEEGSCESFSDTSSSSSLQHEISDANVDDGPSAGVDEPAVKSLLGKGKSRIVFCLKLNMARAQILLMKEDGSSLATLSQDNFLTDIKVFPSSFTIKASLGNLRISDDSLPDTHCYFWACDMRNPGGSSFVELEFCSFNVDDEDYEGYDYSLLGELCEVRIVYLNRFIQEVISYFMGLVPNDSKDFVRIKDQGTNSEKWFTRNEVEGSPALKLDVSLRKPIILMPRRTDSLDFLKLDVVHITIQNSFQWFCGSKNEINAVHMEILTVSVKDINLNVGAGSELGESIIQDVSGISIVIQRSLRDLLHQIPSVDVSVKMEELKAALSSTEYEIITECAQANFSETPNTLPPLIGDYTSPSAVMTEPLALQSPDTANTKTEDGIRWITTKVSVSINLVELCLYYGLKRDASLATLQVSSLWLLYKSNTAGEGFLSSTLGDFAVVDDREGIQEELKLAIRKPETFGYRPSKFVRDGDNHPDVKTSDMEDLAPSPTMIILDAKFGECSTLISLCIQRPQLLVALDFLLAVAEFFVPTVRSMLSNDDDRSSSHLIDALILDQPTYIQPCSEFFISPLKPLVADDERYDLFVYDGKGGILYLQDRQGKNLSSPSVEALFYVGSRKKLQFKNVTIKNGKYLDSCILLGPNSSYSVSEDDKVYLEEVDEWPSEIHHSSTVSGITSQSPVSRSTELIFEMQAIGPELTFYNSSKDVGESLVLLNKLLHAQLDAFCRVVLKGDTTEIDARFLGLTMESNGVRIVEPFDTSMKYTTASGKTNIHFTVSDVFMNFSFSILRLFLAVEEDVLAFLRTTSKKMTVVCSEFDKIGTIKYGEQMFVFWRPHAPPGYAILGDYLTPTDKPPTKGVIAVNSSIVRVKRPESFTLIWSSSQSQVDSELCFGTGHSDEDRVFSIWFPQAPKGYVALGCVASPGSVQPSSSSVFCISASLVSPCGLRDCISIGNSSRSSSLAFWRVDNSVGTFLPADPTTLSLSGRAYGLRHVIFGLHKDSSKSSESSENGAPSSHHNTLQQELSSSVNSGRRFEAVATFRLIWWNQGSGSRKRLSIWRPIVPQGMVYFGDIAVQGYEPPNTCIVFHESDEILKAPLDFQLVGHIKKHKSVDSISLWMPQPPSGFVSLGCIACKGTPKQSDFTSLRCIRNDMVTGAQFSDESIWDTSEIKFMKYPFSIWVIGNDLGPFVVRSGFKKPPKRFALKLADQDIPSGSDNMLIDAEIRTFSVALFDDYGGLMVPLCNVSLSGIGFNLHGQSDNFNSSVTFSLAGRSYNDKYDSWEPLIEPVDGLLRYQYDINAPGAASQLRFTSTRDLNLNVSVSNVNTIFQAYASWNNLSHINESYEQETVSPTDGGKPIIDIHHKKNYFIIPRNKLGQDIFIRTTGMLPTKAIKMPSGDSKPVKVPVAKNMLDSHMKGNNFSKCRAMVTVVVAEAELKKVAGLSSHQYTVAVRLFLDQNQPGLSLLHEQSARTRGISIDDSSAIVSVQWNEVFFFRIDSLDFYNLELVVTDIGKGDAVGYFSAPLKHISGFQDNLDGLNWIELFSDSPAMTSGEERVMKSAGRIKCACYLSPQIDMEISKRSSDKGKKVGFIQISPTREGPWTTVKLNYAAPAACWRLGNNVVASEVTIMENNRYVNIRSLVSVRNDTEFAMHLRLKLRTSDETMPPDNERKEENDNGYEFVRCELFETQKYTPTAGWVGLDFNEMASGVGLPSGWEWVDEWHVDNSSIKITDGWAYAPNVESLKWPESCNPVESVNYARQRRWLRHRTCVLGDLKPQICVGPLRPGEVTPLPLSALTQSGRYVLQFRPSNLEQAEEYSWSSVIDRTHNSHDVGMQPENSGICVSTLQESEELLYCSLVSGTSSSSRGMWFCLSIQATEIAKDVHSNPIQDWTLVIRAPLSISNYLPLVAEYSVLESQNTGHFLACVRGVFNPGDCIKVYNADIRNPLYFSLLPQRGWLPVHEAVPISHPSKVPNKTISLRSSVSGRVVQIILEHSHAEERPFEAKVIKVYSPYWLSIRRCPPLTLRFLDLGGKKSRKISFPFKSTSNSEAIFEEITEEEIYDGYTIASALNFNKLGLAASINHSGEEHFGPITDLSPLSNMDGSLDLHAYDADGNCMQIFISSKPCPYQSAPTKVISVRPFITFTNRVGQDLFIKLSSEDEPKVLHASDARVSFVVLGTTSPNELQVRLNDTNWSFPIQIVKEDSIFLVLRKADGTRRFLRVEIRGFEEGSRFIVVFRLGSTNGPIRIENRTSSMIIRIRQSGFDDDTWIQLLPLSTTNFSWEDPYGQKLLDAEIHSENRGTVWKFDLNNSGFCSKCDGLGLLFHVVDLDNIRVARFLDENMPILPPNEGSTSLTEAGNSGSSRIQSQMQESGSPVELTIELGAVGVSVVNHRPKELSYLYFERVSISYSTGYDGGTTSRFKLIVGYLQFDNQLPLTLMPVLLAPEQTIDVHHPVFKMTVTVQNEIVNGIQVYPYVYVRVTDKCWRLNIHEPIIWAFVEFYNNLQLDRLPKSTNVSQVDPEIRIDLIDISEVRLKLSLEPAPAQRPRGVLGVWSPILSAIGNAFKIQVHLRPVMRRDRFMRKSAVVSAIGNRFWRDLIHNPLHLIFSVDVLGMASSTLASLSKGFAELSTDGQFLQLRSKQVWSRRITGVGEGIIQGTEALAQGVAFGVSGVVTKPVESARQNGLLGLAHGLGRAVVGFIAQPVSGALDFFSLTVDGIGASCTHCIEILSNKTIFQRIRNPRAIHADNVLRDYCEREALGQMILYLAEERRHFGCTELFKEPSKFAWSDYYEDHFVVPYQRIVLVTNKRVMLLQCVSPDKMDKKPCKIMWDVPWEELLALELAKAGYSKPSHVIIHLKNFRRSEKFVRVVKCNTDEESEEPQAVRICSVVRKWWKEHQSDMQSLELKVPSSQRHVCFSWDGADGRDPSRRHKTIIGSGELSSSSSASIENKSIQHVINFSKVWSSEQEPKGRCTLCQKQNTEESGFCTIWRPICPSGYVPIGDIIRTGSHPPNAAAVYCYSDKNFAPPMGYDLVWRNCSDDYTTAVSIWHPRAPDGYVSLGCVAVPCFTEPEPDDMYCIAESLVEETVFEEQKMWSAPNSFPWACHIYQVHSEALHFVALRQPKEESDWKPMRVIDDPQHSVQLP